MPRFTQKRRAYGGTKRRAPRLKRTKTVRRRRRGTAARSGQYSSNVINRGRDRVVVWAKKAAIESSTITGTGLVLANLNATYNISGMPDLGSYTPLFNEYLFKKIIVTYRLSTLEQTDDATVPRMYFRYNYDTTWTGTNLATMQELPGVRSHVFEPGATEFRVTVYPKIPVPTYFDVSALTVAAAFGSTISHKNMWLDTFNSTMAHYGYMYVITGLATGQKIVVDYEYTVGFRYRR